MENEEPKHLTISQTSTGKNSQAIIHGDTVTEKATRPLKEKGQKKKKPPQKPDFFHSWGKMSFICKDLGLRSCIPATRTKVRLRMGGVGGRRHKTNETKRLQKGRTLPNLSVKTYVNWRRRSCSDARGGEEGTGRVAEVRRGRQRWEQRGPETVFFSPVQGYRCPRT